MLRRWAPVLLVLLVALAYVPTLGAPFVWDDRYLVLEAPAVTSLQPLSSYFTHAFWSQPESGDVRAYYRPLVILSLALDHRIHGLAAGGYHLTNALLHTVNALLLYALLRRHRVQPGTALGLGATWALLPRLTEAAAWIAGRTDVMAGTFVLLALWLHRPASPRRAPLTAVLLLMGLFCKEVAIAGVVAVAVRELSPGRGAVRALRHRAPFALAPVAALTTYLALRAQALAGASSIEAAVAPIRRLELAAAATGSYARMMVAAWTPELQIGSLEHPPGALMALGVLVGMTAMVALVRGRHRLLRSAGDVASLLQLGLCLCVVGVGVVSHLVTLHLAVIAADRFLYLPTIGLALLMAPFVAAARPKLVPRPVLAAASGALVLSLFVATFVRVQDWCSEVQLWARAFRDTPHPNWLPANELGNVYYRAGMFEEAAGVYARAVADATDGELRPGANLAKARSQLGEYDVAAAWLGLACEQEAAVAHYCLDAGLAELHRGHLEASRRLLQLAVARAGSYPAASAALERIPRVEALMRAPDLTSDDPRVSSEARFRLAESAGRRLEALALARTIVGAATLPRPLRREALEFFVRFGSPGELTGIVQTPAAADVLDPALLAAASLRVQTAEELRGAWGSLGVERWRVGSSG